MWPWGHVGVAYVLYSFYTRSRYDRPPRDAPAIIVVVGSQVPDLIDKPLAWWLGVLPGGRTLAHSLLFAAVLIPIVYAIAALVGRVDLATAYTIGHLSHLGADLPPTVLRGDLAGTEFLLWPLLDQPTFTDESLFIAPATVESAVGVLSDPQVYALVQIGIAICGAILWVVDGYPSLAYIRR